LALLTAMSLLLVVFAVGCQTTDPPGRYPVDYTTDAENRDPRQHPVTMTEFRRIVPQALLQRLPIIPEVSEVPGPVTILMGDINNKTNIVPTADYEYITSGVRNGLINSAEGREKLHFVERRARMERLADRERVATGPVVGDDGIQWAGGIYDVPDYDATRTFALNMDIYRIGRGNTHLYAMEVQLVSFATNRIVFSEEYEMKQVSD